MANASDVAFQGVRFAAPAGMTDTSVLSFVDRVGAPSVSMTVAQEALAGGAAALKVYVDDQQKAAQKAVPGYAVQRSDARTIGGAPGFWVEGVAASAHKPRRVIQLYALHAARERVFVVTATAPDADAQKARDAVEQVAKTLSFEGAQ